MPANLRDIHIGSIIDGLIRRRGMTYAQVARQLHVDRTTLYSIVRSKSIDVERLIRISEILNYDLLRNVYLPLTPHLSAQDLAECLRRSAEATDWESVARSILDQNP